MKKGKIIILSGPSGSGKTTLHHRLLKDKALKGKLVKTISMTTRLPRPGEKNGRDYFYISEKMFCYKRQAGHFLESEKVFAAYYGTSAKQVRDILKTGKSVLLCIDVKGAETVKKRASAEVIRIFVKPPSLSVLKQRLTDRKTEKAGDLQLRLQTAKSELLAAKDYDEVVINDDLGHAYRELKAVVNKIIAA